MSQCTTCGAVVNPGDARCANCGAAVSTASAPPPPPPAAAPQQQQYYAPQPGAASAGAKPYADGDAIHLFLAYFGLFALIPYLMFKDQKANPQKEYVFWHARQGLALTLAWFAMWVGVTIFGTMLAFMHLGVISILLWGLVWFASLGIFVLVIMGWVKAFGGVKWQMPLIDKVVNVIPG